MAKSPILSLGTTQIVTLENISVPHGCSTRLGGVSEGHLSSLNTGFTVGDEASRVWENRRRFAATLGVENLPWLLSMTHGNRVVVVDERAPLPDDLSCRPSTFYEADGCVTNVPGVPLSLTVADCVPVFFHDPVAKAVGLAHAGWRGTVGGIVEKTVATMIKHFGVETTNLQVGIGPSIGPKAFEVGPEVADEFRKVFSDVSDIVRPHPDQASRAQGKVFVDLWRANSVMALRAGVPPANLMTSGWCTVGNPDLFFSHRRDKGKSGRLIAGIILS